MAPHLKLAPPFLTDGREGDILGYLYGGYLYGDNGVFS